MAIHSTMQTFHSFLASTADEATPELPLVHSTEAAHIRGIFTAAELRPRPCPVFNNLPLTYLFYGRPAYQSKQANTATASPTLCPICFVFKPHSSPSTIHSVYPFDTGAANVDRFSPYVSKTEFRTFAIDPSLDTVRRLVKCFFTSNELYYEADASSFTLPADAEVDLTKYYNLITHQNPVDYDDRRSAVEIAVEDAIPLKDSLLAVVLPAALMGDENIKKMIYEVLRCCPLMYRTYHGLSPGGYSYTIREVLFNYLRSGGYL